MRTEALNRFGLSHAVAQTESGHPEYFRERARDDQVGMILDHWNHAFVISTVGVMMVGLVNQDDCLAWRFHEQVAHFALWRNARRGIVRIANVDQAFAGGGEHLRQIVSEG